MNFLDAVDKGLQQRNHLRLVDLVLREVKRVPLLEVLKLLGDSGGRFQSAELHPMVIQLARGRDEVFEDCNRSKRIVLTNHRRVIIQGQPLRNEVGQAHLGHTFLRPIS